MRKRTPRFASVLTALAVLAAGCGAPSKAIELGEPTITGSVPSGLPATTTTIVAPPTTRTIGPVADDGVVKAVVTPTGVVAAVRSVRTDGSYVVVSPCARDVVVARATPVPRVHVVLDPGHGGAADPGSVGKSGLTEAQLNLRVAELTKAELEAAGVSVALTRTANGYLSLAARGAIVTSLGPAAFVSIHHNGGPNRTAPSPGTEVYYQVADVVRSKRLAGLIYEEVVAALATTALTAWSWYDDAGVKVRVNDQGGDYYGILRNAAGVPSALVELAYLSATADEEALLRTDEVRRLEAGAVARGIVRYLTTDDPGSGYVGPSQRTGEAVGGGTTGCVDPPLQ